MTREVFVVLKQHIGETSSIFHTHVFAEMANVRDFIQKEYPEFKYFYDVDKDFSILYQGEGFERKLVGYKVKDDDTPHEWIEILRKEVL